MNTIDLIRIAEWAVERTRKIIPFSANYPDRKDRLYHRYLMVGLTRREANTSILRAFEDEVCSWNLDLSKDLKIENKNNNQNLYPLNIQQFWIESLQSYLSLEEMNLLVSTFPRRDQPIRPNESTQDKLLREIVDAEKVALRAAQLGAGNCNETTDFTFFLLQEYPAAGLDGLPPLDEVNKIPVEKLALSPQDDHVFIVLNRNESTSTLNDVKTWNDDAIIVDSWTKEVYTKKQLFEGKYPKERQFLIDMLSKVRLLKKAFLGDIHNSQIHSLAWHQEHFKFPNTFPKRCLDIKEKTKVTENLPKRIDKTPLTIKFTHQYRHLAEAEHIFLRYLQKEPIHFDKLKRFFLNYLRAKQKLEEICNKLLENGEWNSARKLLLRKYLPKIGKRISLSLTPEVNEYDWRDLFIKIDEHFKLWKTCTDELNLLLQTQEFHVGKVDLNRLSSQFYSLKKMFSELNSYAADLTKMQSGLHPKQNCFVNIPSVLVHSQKAKEIIALMNVVSEHEKLSSTFLWVNDQLQSVADILAMFNKTIYNYKNLSELKYAYQKIKHCESVLQQVELVKVQLNREIKQFDLQLINNFNALNISYSKFPMLKTDTDARNLLRTIHYQIEFLEHLESFESWILLIKNWHNIKRNVFSASGKLNWFKINRAKFNESNFGQFQRFSLICAANGVSFEYINQQIATRYQIDFNQYKENYMDCRFLFSLYWQRDNQAADLDLEVSPLEHQTLIELIKKYIDKRSSFTKPSTLWYQLTCDNNLKEEKIMLAKECLFIVERIKTRSILLNVIDSFMARNESLEMQFGKTMHSLQAINFHHTLMTMRDIVQPSFLSIKNTISNNNNA